MINKKKQNPVLCTEYSTANALEIQNRYRKLKGLYNKYLFMSK